MSAPVARQTASFGMLLALLASACSGGGSTQSSAAEQVPNSTSTAAVTTSPPASSIISTTTLSFAERLPATRSDVPGIVETATGVMAAVVESTGDVITIVTPCGEQAVVANARQLGSKLVVIDPGHGGSEPGAVGAGGLHEADLNLAVAKAAVAVLEADGVSVALTRNTDMRLTLAARAAIARAAGARAFVSIHHNADPDGPSDKPGTEVWYQAADRESRRLAGIIYEDVFALMSGYNADWVSDTDAGAKIRLNDRGTDYYGILRNSVGTPAVIAELAFISNPSEEQLLATAAVKNAEGAAVASAVERYLTTADDGSGFVEAYERVTPAGSGGSSKGCVDPPLE